MIRVINKYREKPPHGAINIMRGTVLGNPYRIGRDGNRGDVIAKYHQHLRQQYRNNQVVRKLLHDLAKRYLKGETLVLVCCCKPMACHGDIVRYAIQKIAEALK